MTATDRTQLAAALRLANVACADELAGLAAPSYRLIAERAALDSLALGASRFAGSPDVPEGFRWPMRAGVPLTFLAQLDLTQIAAPGVPARGWLLFFYDVQEEPWGFDPADVGGAQVLFFACERSELTRTEHPVVIGMEEELACCALAVSEAIDLPDSLDVLVSHAGLAVREQDFDAYTALAETWSSLADEEGPYHHLLGHPQLVQDDMRVECELVTHGIYCGNASGYRSEEARALEARAAPSWTLLLQLDSDEDGPGWMWGDGGRIYFWIRTVDLAAQVFERVWVVLQCT